MSIVHVCHQINTGFFYKRKVRKKGKRMAGDKSREEIIIKYTPFWLAGMSADNVLG